MNFFERIQQRFHQSNNASSNRRRKSSLHRKSVAANNRHSEYDRPLQGHDDQATAIVNIPASTTTQFTRPGQTIVPPPTLRLSPPSDYQATCPVPGSSLECTTMPDEQQVDHTPIGPTIHRPKTPISSFYNVSSDEDDGDGDDDSGDDKSTTKTGDCTTDKTIEFDDQGRQNDVTFDGRQQRLRRSMHKAKAALPADFADRLLVDESTLMGDGDGDIGDADLAGGSTTNRSRPTADDSTETNNNNYDDDSGETNRIHPPPSASASLTNESLESLTSNKPSSDNNSSPINKRPPSPLSSNDIEWRLEDPRPLEELIVDFRTTTKSSSSQVHLLRSVCQRPSCKCLLREYDSLMAYLVPDALFVVANFANANSKPPPVKNVKSSAVNLINYHRDGFPRSTPSSSASLRLSDSPAESQQLILFRQCRGWYEVLNEDLHACPCITNIDQFRRVKPHSFLLRRDLRCLAAPETLSLPQSTVDQLSEVGGRRSTLVEGQPPPLPSYSSTVVAMATDPETLASSTPQTLPAGTILSYISYLPHCSLKRGRKIKELGLILATVKQSRGELTRSSTSNPRTYYIGTEDSTPAVFPPKVAISPLAQPENISGVHSLASIVRKFRLPLSIRPVSSPQTVVNGSNLSTASSPPRFSSGLFAIDGLRLTDHSYLRLTSMYRNDLLIISPVTESGRIFLISPSMLNDHLFHVGHSVNPGHETLMLRHKIQSQQFLASAHPKASLNYLLRHTQNVTKLPRLSSTGKSPYLSTSSSELPEGINSPEELVRAYEEIDDLYFYIRHGYYPSRSRRPTTPVNDPSSGTISTSSTTNKLPRFHSTVGQFVPNDQRQRTPRRSMGGGGNMAIPTPDQLLAKSLTPSQSSSNANLRNSRYVAGESSLANIHYQQQQIVQAKEYGI